MCVCISNIVFEEFLKIDFIQSFKEDIRTNTNKYKLEKRKKERRKEGEKKK